MSYGSNSTDFLRESDIRVRLDFELERNLDRVVELINRTNQLNFTKARLPEAHQDARAAAVKLISAPFNQGALVHVRDRYGDHGYCGIYIYDSEARRLVHFCFSCRILGMGVEQWVYQKLQRPHLNVSGEVLSNVFDETLPYDWITLESERIAEDGAVLQSRQFPFEAITARGGCETGAIIHYFAATLPDARGEYNIHRCGSTFRIDHSVFLRHARCQLNSNFMSAVMQLGYIPVDFETRVFKSFSAGHLVLLSFTCDAMHALYRHRSTGLTIPFTVPGHNPTLDARLIGTDDLPQLGWIGRAVSCLREEFDYIGLIDEQHFNDNVSAALTAIAPTSQVVIIEPNDYCFNWDSGDRLPVPRFARLNDWTRSVCQGFRNVQVVRSSDFIHERSDLPLLFGEPDVIHFDRKVYFRIFQRIMELFGT